MHIIPIVLRLLLPLLLLPILLVVIVMLHVQLITHQQIVIKSVAQIVWPLALPQGTEQN
jgi:hypothetical protein